MSVTTVFDRLSVGFYTNQKRLSGMNVRKNFSTLKQFKLIQEIITGNSLIDEWWNLPIDVREKNPLYDYIIEHELLTRHIDIAKGSYFKSQALISYLIFTFVFIEFVNSDNVIVKESFSSYENYCRRYRVSEELRDFDEDKQRILKDWINVINFLKKHNVCDKKSGKNIIYFSVMFMVEGNGSTGSLGGGLSLIGKAKINMLNKLFGFIVRPRKRKGNKTVINHEQTIRIPKNKRVIRQTIRIPKKKIITKCNNCKECEMEIMIVANILLKLKND